jgi:hypothetical protein
VIVGDIEPTPAPVNAAGLADWLDAYTTAVGQAPAFLHLDVDWGRTSWPSDSVAIAKAAHDRGVPLGMIYNGGSATTDAAWLWQAGSRVLAYADAAGADPDHVVFQSWMDKPDFTLPETEPTSFTALVNRYFDDRASLDDPPAGAAANVALGQPATASGSLSGSGPANAVDGDADTLWNAGAGPPASITIDLGAVVQIAEFRLLVGQDPAGGTVHVISGRATANGRAVTLGTLDGLTRDNTVLVMTVDPSAPAIRYLTVATTSSPSWVAWREIEVIAAP